MDIRFRGKRFRKQIGESVQTANWNRNTQRCRLVAAEPLAAEINAKIDNWERAAKETIKHFTSQEGAPVSEKFWTIFTKALTGTQNTREAEIGFTAYFRNYIQTKLPGRTYQTVHRFTRSCELLEDFEQKSYRRRLKFEDIDMNFYRSFRRYCDALGFAENTFGAFVRSVKAVFREAKVVDRLHNESGIEHRDFVAVSTTADAVYLTEEELLKIYELDFSAATLLKHFPGIDRKPQNLESKIKAYQLIRARFLIGAFTGLRVSDFKRIGEVHIDGDFIRTRTAKTGRQVVIPMHWIVRELLDAGFDLSDTVSEQKINKHIKEIAMIAGIDNEVEVSRVEGGKRVTRIFKKYELVSTHTARRSFATNAYKAGVPSIAIMKITGHTRENTFLKYIRVSAEENAELLAEHKFFVRAERS